MNWRCTCKATLNGGGLLRLQSRSAELTAGPSMPGENKRKIAPGCTVAICTHDRPEMLTRCLEAVAKLEYPEYEVLVVDNAPSDDRTREVTLKRNAHYITEPVVGLSRSRNRAVEASHTEVIAFLDDDAIPEPSWLASLMREFSDAQVMAVTGRVLPLPLGGAGCDYATVCDYEFGGGERLAVDRGHPLWFALSNFGGIGLGMNMAFRRSAFEDWQGFDERLGRGTWLYGFEEHYAFFSLISKGHRVVYTPSAVVEHPAPRTLPEARAHRMRSLTATVGYMVFLFMEEPRYRGATLRYIVQGLTRGCRTWRHPMQRAVPPLVSRWRTLLACLSGPWLYIRSRSPGRRLADRT